MSGMTQIETVFLALLGRAPLPHELEAYAEFESSPQELGLKLMSSSEIRRRAMLGEFSIGSSQWVCAEIRDGLKLWVDLLDAGVSAGAIAGNWEPNETNFILSILKKDGCFLDIGAHIGWFTILAAHHVGPRGRVYSFEPRQAIFNYLNASVEANGFQDRCTLYRAALSDTVSTTRMATYSSEHNSGHAFIVVGQTPEGADLIEDIPTLTLDGLKWDRKIDVLKIDVEGAEAIVLKGGSQLLMRDRPIIVSELFPRWLHNVSGTSADQFLETLKGFGYRLFELTDHGIGREIHNLNRANLVNDEYFINIVCLTENHIAEHLLRPLDGRVESYMEKIKLLHADFEKETKKATKQNLIRVQLETDLTSLRDEFESNLNQLELQKQSYNQLNQEMTSLKSELDIKMLQVQQQERKYTQAEAEIADLRSDLKAKEQERTQAGAEITALRSGLEAKALLLQQQAQQLTQAEAEIIILRSELETKTRQAQQQAHQRTQAEAEISDLRCELDIKRQHVRQQELKHAVAETEIASLRSDFEIKVLRNKKKELEYTKIQAEILTLRSDLENKNHTIQHNYQQHVQAEAEIAALRSELNDKNGWIEHNYHRHNQTKAKLEALHSAFVSLQDKSNENEYLRLQAEQEIKNLQELAGQLAVLQASNSWRACMVLIRIGRYIPSPLRRFMVRLTKLGWWSITGKLPERLSQRQIFLRSLRTAEIILPTPSLQAENTTIAAAIAPDPFEPVMAETTIPSTPPIIEPSRWEQRRGPVALIVDHCWPEPDRDSGSVDAINLVQQLLTLGFEVVYASAGSLIQPPRFERELCELGAKTVSQTGPEATQKYIEDNRDIFSLIVLSRVSCGGAFFELIRYNCPDTKIIFNTVDLHFLREVRAAQLNGDRNALAHAEQTRRREEFLTGKADLTIVVSDVEAEILSVAVPRAPILHLPLAREITLPTARFETRKRIGFIGGFSHQPNLDAVCWFLAEVWPLVRKKRPNMIFSIAGSALPENIAKPEEGVVYEGPVDDLHGWFETLVMSVAPLRIGAGAKGKVVSSLTNGLPCVISAIAAEGMGLTDGITALVAGAPEIFAEKIIALAEDETLWHALSEKGLEYAQTHFSYQANLNKLHKALIGIGVPVNDSTSAAVSHC